jgi:hypothetical protein
MNEAGKTVSLQAPEKSRDAVGAAKFDPIEDYPRKDLTRYMRRHESEPDVVTELTYLLTATEREALKQAQAVDLPADFSITITRDYKNELGIYFDGPAELSSRQAVPSLGSRHQLNGRRTHEGRLR